MELCFHEVLSSKAGLPCRSCCLLWWGSPQPGTGDAELSKDPKQCFVCLILVVFLPNPGSVPWSNSWFNLQVGELTQVERRDQTARHAGRWQGCAKLIWPSNPFRRANVAWEDFAVALCCPASPSLSKTEWKSKQCCFACRSLLCSKACKWKSASSWTCHAGKWGEGKYTFSCMPGGQPLCQQLWLNSLELLCTSSVKVQMILVFGDSSYSGRWWNLSS